jgi:hypothetical protein
MHIFKTPSKKWFVLRNNLIKLFASQNSQIQNAPNLFLFDCFKTGVFSSTKDQIGVIFNECLGVI